MQPYDRTESQHADFTDDFCAYWRSFSECRCLQFLWSRQLVWKWLQFKPTGDDFRSDHHFDIDSFVVDDEENSKTGSDCSRDGFDFYSGFVFPKRDADLKRTSRPLIRSQSETLRKQYVDTTDYLIAVGTWNVAGKPPPEGLDVLDEWLDSNEEADIYVLGFQEIVPLNAGNVLCVEDEGPPEEWEKLIRRSLNSKATTSFKPRGRSAPLSPWRDFSVSEVPQRETTRIIEGVANEERKGSVVKGESSRQSNVGTEKPLYEDSKHGSFKACTGTGRGGSNDSSLSSEENVRTAEFEDEVEVGLTVSGREIIYREPELITSPAEGFHTFLEDEESLQIPLVKPNPVNENFNRDRSRTKSRYSRIASKQMVGLFITVWVRSDLRRFVHNVQVSCVGCGLMGYLGNKGSISVSMCLHQTSFCFICSHLTSGHTEGDELRRNADVAEILRRTYFPRSSKSWQLPETIMSHDCKIWLGDLNYRIDLPHLEAISLVAREEWSCLLEKDQLTVEQTAGHVFDGWQEGPIYFPPTYKYAINSDRFSGEGGGSGEKVRTPGWCDRILWLGKSLRETRYIRTESTLSDHRPVSAVFVAEVETVSRHKLKRTVTSIPDASARRGNFFAASISYNLPDL